MGVTLSRRGDRGKPLQGNKVTGSKSRGFSEMKEVRHVKLE